MNSEEAKAFVRGHFEDFVNRKDLSAADRNFAADYQEHGADVPPGLPAEKSQFYCNAILDKSAGNEYSRRVFAGDEHLVAAILEGQGRDGAEDHLRRALDIYKGLLAKNVSNDVFNDKPNIAIIYRDLSS